MPAGMRNNFVPYILKIIIEMENGEIFNPVKEEEVNKIIFSVHKDKAPGPNGFPSRSYQRFQHTFIRDLVKMVEEARSTRKVSGRIKLLTPPS